jgi:hypothetical protein
MGNSLSLHGYTWDMEEAKVACQQLYFTKAVGPWRYGQGKGKIWLNYMDCSVGSSCNYHTRDVGFVVDNNAYM